MTPATLWPPNGKLVPVTIVATITDAGSGVDPHTTAYTVEDEYEALSRAVPLPSGGRPLHRYYSLQASRHGNDRDGRLYTITVSAFDDEGNEGQRPPASLCRMIRGRVGASPRASVPQACPPGPTRRARVGP